MPILNGDGIDPAHTTPTGFRIKRATATLSGYRPGVDKHVVGELAILRKILARKVIDPKDPKALAEVLRLPLTPRRAGTEDKVRVGKWANGSLADKLRSHTENPGEQTVGQVVASTSEGSDLRYAFTEAVHDRTRDGELDLNQSTVLAYDEVRDLLLARAVVVHQVTRVKSLMNFVLHDPDGVQEVIDCVVVGAARQHIHERRLRVRDIDLDTSHVVVSLKKAGLSFSADSFADRVVEISDDAVSYVRHEDLLAAASIKPEELDPKVLPRLIDYLETSPIPVTKANASFMVPYYLLKASAGTNGAAPSSATLVGASDDPFRVDFFTEDVDQVRISTSAVKCASQLYYVMTLGDELGVFDAVRHFTTSYLFRQGFAVEDKVLRRDLENYVFSEQFTGRDTVDGEMRTMRSTHEAERRSFYRQVFDMGNEPIPGDAPPNSDFGRLWKILMLEATRYLERAQASPHPDTYVSRQNVMQAVEDLQYNLSSSCVGMSTVMTPLMYAELEFVVNRILGHKEVRRHLVPAGGSWWKVVEKLAADRNRRLRASVLYNKARLGYSLIRDIADYTPSRFEQDARFSTFISNVEAFITTQSIIQEESDEDSGDHAWGEDERRSGAGGSPFPGMPSIPGLPDGIPGMPWGSGGYGAGGPGAGYGSAGSQRPAPATVGNGHGQPPAAGDEWDF